MDGHLIRIDQAGFDGPVRLKIYQIKRVRSVQIVETLILLALIGYPLFLYFRFFFRSLKEHLFPYGNFYAISVLGFELGLVGVALFIRFSKRGGWNNKKYDILEFSADAVIRYSEKKPEEKLIFPKSEIKAIILQKNLIHLSCLILLDQSITLKIKRHHKLDQIIKLRRAYMGFEFLKGFKQLNEVIHGVSWNNQYPKIKNAFRLLADPFVIRILILPLSIILILICALPWYTLPDYWELIVSFIMDFFK